MNYYGCSLCYLLVTPLIFPPAFGYYYDLTPYLTPFKNSLFFILKKKIINNEREYLHNLLITYIKR